MRKQKASIKISAMDREAGIVEEACVSSKTSAMEVPETADGEVPIINDEASTSRAISIDSLYQGSEEENVNVETAQEEMGGDEETWGPINYRFSNDILKINAAKTLQEVLKNLYLARGGCCIYRVPEYLRKINEKAYTPLVISIGPLHYGKPEFSAMEIQKIIFAKEFRKGISTEMWPMLKNFIKENEQRILNSYADIPLIKKSKFRKMILYDAIFIIKYLLGSFFNDDFLINNLRQVKWPIWTDLLLLENQLPYFVLEELYMIASSELRRYHRSFFSLAFKFFCFDMPKEPQKKEAKHFTDLRRCAMTNWSGAVKPQESGVKRKLSAVKRDLPCVVKLQDSGVKFKRLDESKCFLDIRLQKTELRRIHCLDSEVLEPLQIPPIGIYDQTECWIRNVMALEQCHYLDETHVCNYISLMDDLINTEEDVNLLVEEGIISNCVGNTDTIAKMFNGLCLHIDLSTPSCYDQVVKDLKAHYVNPWNHTKATLKRVYFPNLWRGTGTVAAIVLLVFTLIQTICSIISVV